MHYAKRKMNGRDYFDLAGDFTFLDSDTFIRLQREFVPANDLIGGSSDEIWLDVGGLQRIDSTALALLIAAFDEAKRKRRRLVFANPQGEVLQKLTDAASCNSLTIA